MKLQQPISTIMTPNVLSVQIDETLDDALAIIQAHHIRHIPVLKGDHLVGMISRTDINRLTFGALIPGQESADEAILEMLSISQVMSHHPRVVKASQSIQSVAEILAQEEFHALPVVSDENDWELVGIITTTDLIKLMLSDS